MSDPNRPTQPPPAPRGAQPDRAAQLAAGIRRSSAEQPKRARSQTLAGSPAPPSNPPPRDMPSEPDTGVTSFNSIVTQYKAEKDRADAAEARLADVGRSSIILGPGVDIASRSDVELGRAVRTILKQGAAMLVTAALGALGVTLVRPAANPDRVAAQGTQLDTTSSTLRDHADRLEQTERDVRALKAWSEKYPGYDRQVFARLGVRIPALPELPPPDTVEFTAPLRKPNVLSGGVILEVETPPPAPP